jgi:UDP-N-acetylmuramoyl-L-alanyl-D-glutamate--2,6-diaminopimelate ligase
VVGTTGHRAPEARGSSGGAPALPADVEVEVDRAVAIARAVELAGDGDVVLIAGKGAEQGQEYADRTIPFDDREAAREALRA